MASPNPALVSEREAQALPRIPLLLLCAAYLLPGIFGRDPWKSADITAYGYIVNLASGKAAWLAPTVGGLPADGAQLPYWLGAAFVRLTAAWLDPIVAARIPFVLLLAAVLALTWYAAFHLARSTSAQPLPFAFGGEASTVDYARAIADGALLALIASLGLLQLGHETTPELAQLFAVALYLYGAAVSPSHPWRGAATVAIALPVLAASGAPSVTMWLAAIAAAIAFAARQPGWHRLVAATAVGAVLAAVVATALGAWANRIGDFHEPQQAWRSLRGFVWFAWPAWFLAVWTLWRWRRRLLSPHLAMPVACVATLLGVWVAMAGADRALMLVLPPLAVLAAFALPTLERSAAAAIDWFSVFFFTIAATAVWLFYVAIQTGSPAKLAANVAKLSPGYAGSFSAGSLVAAGLATLAWLWLVRWRTGRHRHPLWKSLVLPAGGVSLIWLLVMTLLLPPLDNARSYRSQMQRLATHIPVLPPGECIAAPDLSRAAIVALESLGGWTVDAATPLAATRCGWLVLANGAPRADDVWLPVARERRLRKDDDVIDVYRRKGSALR